MTCKYQELLFGPLQPMPPFLQRQLHHQQLSVSDAVVLFRWGQTSGKESTRMYFLVDLRPLTENGPNASVRCVNFNNVLFLGVRKGQDWCKGKTLLKLGKCLLHLRGHFKFLLG